MSKQMFRSKHRAVREELTIEGVVKLGPRVQKHMTTCDGCPALKTEAWKEYLENDETDSGTRARCSAAEHKLIGSYWGKADVTPRWCPAAAIGALRESEQAAKKPLGYIDGKPVFAGAELEQRVRDGWVRHNAHESWRGQSINWKDDMRWCGTSRSDDEVPA